ncbi:hypothetical protein Ancab_017525 [Ancistrocladus abbreviatus]
MQDKCGYEGSSEYRLEVAGLSDAVENEVALSLGLELGQQHFLTLMPFLYHCFKVTCAFGREDYRKDLSAHASGISPGSRCVEAKTPSRSSASDGAQVTSEPCCAEASTSNLKTQESNHEAPPQAFCALVPAQRSRKEMDRPFCWSLTITVLHSLREHHRLHDRLRQDLICHHLWSNPTRRRLFPVLHAALLDWPCIVCFICHEFTVTREKSSPVGTAAMSHSFAIKPTNL